MRMRLRKYPSVSRSSSRGVHAWQERARALGTTIAVFLVAVLVSVPAVAQRDGNPESLPLDDMDFRLIGPFRGGRSVAVVGHPTERLTFYFGSAAVSHGQGLYGLVNNAGNMYRGGIADLDEQALLMLFHSNVVAAMMLSGMAAEHLSAARGAIVFLGSIHNRRAFPGVSPYAATKGAIEALTKSLAAELGPAQIRVNCVAPGAVFTEINQRAGLFTDEQAKQRLQGMAELHALGRIGEVEEVAAAIAYFLTAPWTTGTVLEVDGGLALGITSG